MILILGDEKTYLSVDNPCSFGGNNKSSDDIHTPTFLKIVNSSGIPKRWVTTINRCSSNDVEKYLSIFVFMQWYSTYNYKDEKIYA